METKKPVKIKARYVALILFATVIVTIAILINTSDNGGSSANRKEEFNSYRAWSMACGYVETQLKSPASADFPSNPDAYRLVNDSTMMLRGYVDSQNSFGAMIRTHFMIEMQYHGGDWVYPQNWTVTYFKVTD